jgi:hypothetical protein
MNARASHRNIPARPQGCVHAAAVASLCVLLVLGPTGAASAQASTEACKAEKVSSDKMVDFPTAYAAADKRAHAWQSDAVVVRLAQTALGPIDAEARSANWYMIFYSPATKKRISITIGNGVLTCYQDTDNPGRIPILKSGVYRDVKQMLATASEKGGGALMQKGALPAVEMSAGSEVSGYRGLWYINYRVKSGPSLQVTFDGSTGKFEKAIPN